MRFEESLGTSVEWNVVPTTETKTRLQGREARRQKLDSVKRYLGDGFENNEQRDGFIEKIVDVGLPVDNFRKLSRRRNTWGREDVLASWGTGSWNKGEFTVYELLDKQVPEKQLGTIVHENMHGATPLDKENAFLYGSEKERAEAESVVRSIAKQSVDTEVFLNGYHAWLYKQMKLQESGKTTGITRKIFDEETGVIAAELALTNRAKLEQVEEAQHASIDRRFGTGQLESNKKVNLLTHVPEKDSPFVQIGGVDKTLIKLIDGVNDYQDLIKHVDGLKQKFYPDSSLQVSAQRGTASVH